MIEAILSLFNILQTFFVIFSQTFTMFHNGDILLGIISSSFVLKFKFKTITIKFYKKFFETKIL